jgi:hypothetical protein
VTCAFIHEREDQEAAILGRMIGCAFIRERKSQKAAILGRTFQRI